MRRKFKIGDKIKLKDYFLYSDYFLHREEIGIIVEILDKYSDFDYAIKWKDGCRSHIYEDNIIGYKKEVKQFGIVKFWQRIEKK